MPKKIKEEICMMRGEEKEEERGKNKQQDCV